MDKEKRQLARKLIAPAVQVEIDGAGRVNIPQQSREKAGLEVKSEALLLGTGYTIEVWNPETFYVEDEKCEESVSDLAQKIYEEER